MELNIQAQRHSKTANGHVVCPSNHQNPPHPFKARAKNALGMHGTIMFNGIQLASLQSFRVLEREVAKSCLSTNIIVKKNF